MSRKNYEAFLAKAGYNVQAPTDDVVLIVETNAVFWIVVDDINAPGQYMLSFFNKLWMDFPPLPVFEGTLEECTRKLTEKLG